MKELFKKYNALLTGHFLLSSGLHSDTYFQSALILQHPLVAGKLAENLKNEISQKVKEIELKSVLQVPDVKGYSLRKAINVLSASGFDIDINGSGEVIDQMPKSGSTQLPNSKITLFCKQIN